MKKNGRLQTDVDPFHRQKVAGGQVFTGGCKQKAKCLSKLLIDKHQLFLIDLISFTIFSFVQDKFKAHHTEFHPNIESLLFVQFKQKILYISSLIAQSVKYLNTVLQLNNVSSKKYQDLSFGFFFVTLDTKCTLSKTTHTQPGATFQTVYS